MATEHPPPNDPKKPTITIRPRQPSDLDDCVSLLRVVHAKDGYPRVRGISYHDFLASPNIPFAWVAERQRVSSDTEQSTSARSEAPIEQLDVASPTEIIGHVAIGKASMDDLSVRVWRAKHEGSSSSSSSSPSSSAGDDGGKFAILERLFVHPDARGYGIAGRLLETAVQFARELDGHSMREMGFSGYQDESSSGNKKSEQGLRLVLFVLDANADAKRLYERLGWVGYGRGVFEWGEREDQRMGADCFVSPL